MKKKSITTSELDRKFESGEGVIQYLDLKNANQPGLKPKHVSVDFPEWMVDQLDRISNRLGVTRQSTIKIFIAERLEEEAQKCH